MAIEPTSGDCSTDGMARAVESRSGQEGHIAAVPAGSGSRSVKVWPFCAGTKQILRYISNQRRKRKMCRGSSKISRKYLVRR